MMLDERYTECNPFAMIAFSSSLSSKLPRDLPLSFRHHKMATSLSSVVTTPESSVINNILCPLLEGPIEFLSLRTESSVDLY